MRSICVVVGTLALLSSRAEADVSKAWQAAKDHLPATTQMALAVDVAAIVKLPSWNRAFEGMRNEERDLGMAYGLLQSACNVPRPETWVDGLVLAGDTRKKQNGVGFVQVTIDRAKASSCLESVLKTIGGKKPVSVKQDGIYTVASVGNDSVWLAWVAANVVVFSLQPDNKASLDAFINQKGWAKSTAAALAGKMDPKAAVSGVFTVENVDNWFPVSKAFGNFTITGTTLAGSATATFLDTKNAKSFADEMIEERARALKKDTTPAAVKKLMNAVKITTAGIEVTVSGTQSEKDFADALLGSFQKKQVETTASIDEKKIVLELDGFSNKMCACKDRACVDKVNDELTKWGTELAKRAPAQSTKPSPDMAKRTADIMTRYTECMTKLMMSKQP